MHDIFVMVVNFIFNGWTVKHVTIGLCEVIDTRSIIMALKLYELLERFVLIE
jgi:hypothetical protein